MGINAFKMKCEIYFTMPFYAVQNPSFIKIPRLTAPLCNAGHNQEQSKGILIFKMVSSAFLLPLVVCTALKHMLHAKLSGFIFFVEENVTTAMLGFLLEMGIFSLWKCFYENKRILAIILVVKQKLMSLSTVYCQALPIKASLKSQQGPQLI